jgi:hypothetical protein
MNKIIKVIIIVTALGLIALVSSKSALASWGPRANVSDEPQVVVQDEPQGSEPSDTQPLSSGLEGTIKPPGCEGITVVESGRYPVCGVAVVEVDLKEENVEVILTIEPLPTNAGKVLAGTLNLQCRVAGEVHNGSHDEHAEPRVCFAAPPDKEVQINFYDESTQSWVAVETTVEEGTACAPANYSGKYVLVEK